MLAADFRPALIKRLGFLYTPCLSTPAESILDSFPGENLVRKILVSKSVGIFCVHDNIT